jgi:ABC-type multidrug transport system ATPase subunit/ABC-type multidrug transport system permease subunit
MGPSGAGKSSILNVLAGRSAPAPGIAISGRVTVGGKEINPVSFRKNIAYVMQDDSLMATATPRESLRFSARLRLDPSTTDDEIEKMVTDMLEKLGLTSCADVMVGGAMIKGISGGQRKRTSVGVEVITKPSLLFLDEPTSGLDSFSALSMVELLKKVATDNNTAILCTIHQPSSEVFHKFDRVVFMKEGRIFYQGTVPDMHPYFKSRELAPPTGHNPADHVMYLSQKLTHEDVMKRGMYMDDASKTGDAAAIDATFQVVEFEPPVMAGFWLQLKSLVTREFQSIVRDKGALIGRFGVTIFLNALFGVIFWKAGEKDDADRVNFMGHFGALTMVVISSMFGSAQPVMLMFPFERPMFMREYSTGTYGAFAYFVTKTLADLPMTFLQTIVQYVIVYFMVGFQGNFIYLALASFGLGVGSASCGMALGCAVSDVKQVTELSPVIFVPQLLFAGFFVATENIPKVLRWSQWLCCIKYTMNLVLMEEFHPDNESCRSSPAAALNCRSAIESNSIHADDAGWYILALVGIFLVFRLLAASILVSKSKRFY